MADDEPTRRDLFAGFALMGLMCSDWVSDESAGDLARVAFEIADAMQRESSNAKDLSVDAAEPPGADSPPYSGRRNQDESE